MQHPRHNKNDPDRPMDDTGSLRSKNSSEMVRLKPRSLLELDGSASLFELLLSLLGIFLLGLLENRLRSLVHELLGVSQAEVGDGLDSCLLYTSPSPRDLLESRMPSSA